MHEADIYRQGIDVFLHFLAQSLSIVQASGVFLCGNDTTRLGQLLESLINQLDVLLLEMVVI